MFSVRVRISVDNVNVKSVMLYTTRPIVIRLHFTPHTSRGWNAGTILYVVGGGQLIKINVVVKVVEGHYCGTPMVVIHETCSTRIANSIGHIYVSYTYMSYIHICPIPIGHIRV